MGANSPQLYHFTCDHGHQAITRSGVLLPHKHPFMPGLGPLLWLTDLSEPMNAESCGLTNSLTSCDRMAFRYVVHTRAAVRWATVRYRASAAVVANLEAFGQPEHWWIVRRPLLASEFYHDLTWNRAKLRA